MITSRTKSLIDAKAKDWKLVPHHLQISLRLWVDEGVTPEYFLRCVLRNDLASAASYQDAPSTAGLVGLVQFLRNHCPALCWGSPAAVAAWSEKCAQGAA